MHHFSRLSLFCGPDTVLSVKQKYEGGDENFHLIAGF